MNRWVLRISRRHVLLQQQRRDQSAWRDTARHYGVCAGWRFRVGSSHVYYDGNWCGYDLGFISFFWSKQGHCCKCRECPKHTSHRWWHRRMERDHV